MDDLESFSDFKPQHHSSEDECNVTTEHQTQVAESDSDCKEEAHSFSDEQKDISNSDAKPELTSTRVVPPEKTKLQRTSTRAIDDTDINYSGFMPEHHSSFDEEKQKPGKHRRVTFDCLITSSEMQKLINDTDLYLDICLKKVLKQEKTLTAMAYRIYNMGSDVNAYKGLVEQQIRFSVNFNSTFQDYMRTISEALPNYGDLLNGLRQTREETPDGLEIEALDDLSRKILDLSYTGGLNLKTQNSVVGDVSYWIARRILAVKEFTEKQEFRLKIVEDSLIQLKTLVNKIVLLKAQLHYFMVDETHKPITDYSTLLS